MRSPQRAMAGAVSPRRAKNAPSPIQPTVPNVRQRPIMSVGAAAPPAPSPSPARPWYWPWAWAGASPKSSVNVPAAWLTSPTESTAIAAARSSSAAQAGSPAENPIAQQLTVNSSPARRTAAPPCRIVVTFRPTLTWNAITMNVLSSSSAPTLQPGARVCPTIHSGSGSSRIMYCMLISALWAA